MKQVSFFLDKLRSILILDDEIKKNIYQIIKNTTGGKIKKSDIKIFKNILYLKTTPQLKNEILIKKTLILKEIGFA